MIILEQSLFWLFFFCLEKNFYLRKTSQRIASQLCSHFSQSFILTKTPHAAVIGTTSRVLSASWELLPFSWKLLHRWTLPLPSRHPRCLHPECSPFSSLPSAILLAVPRPPQEHKSCPFHYTRHQQQAEGLSRAVLVDWGRETHGPFHCEGENYCKELRHLKLWCTQPGWRNSRSPAMGELWIDGEAPRSCLGSNQSTTTCPPPPEAQEGKAGPMVSVGHTGPLVKPDEQ